MQLIQRLCVTTINYNSMKSLEKLNHLADQDILRHLWNPKFQYLIRKAHSLLVFVMDHVNTLHTLFISPAI